MDYPITHLDYIRVACTPDEPLAPGDPRYASLESLRGGANLKPLQQDLRAITGESAPIHRCVCGHRGSGKSTELRNFEVWARNQKLLPVRIEVDRQFGLINLEATDLFLLAALAAEQALKDANLPVPQREIELVSRWFADVITEDKDEVRSELGTEASAQLKASAFSIAELVGKFTSALRGSSTHATTVRQRLRNYPNHLVDMTNALLRAVNETLANADRVRGLLLIFDNLDRFTPEDIERSLFRSSELVRLLGCHAVFVVPISLEYERRGPIQDCYGPFIMLPMLRLRPLGARWKSTVAESDYDEAAVNTVLEALAKRVNIGHLFARREDAQLLVRLSGGCLRDLMHLLTNAFSRCDEEDTALTSAAVQGAFRMLRGDYVRQLDAADYQALARIANGRTPEVGGEHLRRLLYRRMALEYLDDQEMPYYDIHPLLLEVPEFAHACRTLAA